MWREKVEPILYRHLPKEKIPLVMTYFSAVKSFDEMAQGKATIPDAARAWSSLLLAEKTPQEEAIIATSFKAWADSVGSMVEFNSKTENQKAVILMMRSQFHEFATMYAQDSVKLRLDLVESEVL
jgi:hypothetical protein